jgi:SH3 domain-containing protein
MRVPGAICLAATVLCPFATAYAAEKGSMIRGGDLMEQPYIDAAKAGPLTPKQSVTILERRGGWVQIESEGRTGWVRTLNVRLESSGTVPAAGAGPAPSGGGKPSLKPASLLRTGSSETTVTTGVKGIDDENIRNATVNYAELDQLRTLGVDDAEARANAAKSNLKESGLEYLKDGRK